MDRPIEKKTWPAHKVVIFASIGLGALVLFYQLISRSGDTHIQVDTDRIVFSQVVEAEFQEYVPITGNVMPKTTVFLDLEEGGIIENIFIEGGNPVKKGDLILTFSNSAVQKQNIDSETRLLENLDQLRNSKIALTEKKLMLKEQLLDLDYQILQQEKTFERYDQLFNKENSQISEEVYESTHDKLSYLRRKRELLKVRISQESALQEQQHEQIDASIVRVNKSLEVLSQMMKSLQVQAPIDGYLSSMNVEIGQNFVRGQRIGQIDQLDGYKVRANIDQYYISSVAVGQFGSFKFNGGDHSLKVSKIYPEVTNDVFQLDLEFINSIPDGIKRGQSLPIDLSLSESRMTSMLPKGGFYRQTKGRWVYKISSDGLSARRVDIISGRQNPQYFEVLDGLKVGDRVITSSYELFNDVDMVNFSSSINNVISKR